jgi:hypothetical protein
MEGGVSGFERVRCLRIFHVFIDDRRALVRITKAEKQSFSLCVLVQITAISQVLCKSSETGSSDVFILWSGSNRSICGFTN